MTPPPHGPPGPRLPPYAARGAGEDGDGEEGVAKMSERIGDWIQTFTGRQFWPLDPRPEEICIEDIAHALSNQCRYAGHTECFYSVAEHSYYVSLIVPPEHALWGLLHDATEAYLVDLPRPLKRFSELGKHYKGVERQLMDCVCERFGLAPVEPHCVSEADNVLLCTEKRDLMKIPPKPWVETAAPLNARIFPMEPRIAKRAFLARFRELTERAA